LRAKRWSQESRQWARSARVNLFSVDSVVRNGENGEGLSTEMVWLRTTLSQVRRMLHRGQSRQSTGARGSGGPSEHMEEQVGSEESIGHNTALTRRGFSVVLLS